MTFSSDDGTKYGTIVVIALTPLFGADAVVWTTDIAALEREDEPLG